jgi:hypothetical protein
MGGVGESFSQMLERQASASDFSAWLLAFSQPQRLSEVEWLELVVPVASSIGDFAWMIQEDQNTTRCHIREFIRQAFTAFWVPGALQAATAPKAFEGFVAWMESLSDAAVVRFCWDLLTFDHSRTPEPVRWLKHSGRLAGAISYEHIHLAVSVADEYDAMYWWKKQRWSFVKWERDSQPYLELLSHVSYLARAAAARTLGQMFFRVKTELVHGVPELSKMLGVVQDYESKTPGIAGPFLQGAEWGIALKEWSSFGRGVDMKAWFIETLRRSAQEPEVPHMQSLEFYAHEFFFDDTDAVREFLRMGRTELAVLTASEEPNSIPLLAPVLQEMASSCDPAVSAAIREYLSTRSSHAGLQHLETSDPNPTPVPDTPLRPC